MKKYSSSGSNYGGYKNYDNLSEYSCAKSSRANQHEIQTEIDQCSLLSETEPELVRWIRELYAIQVTTRKNVWQRTDWISTRDALYDNVHETHAPAIPPATNAATNLESIPSPRWEYDEVHAGEGDRCLFWHFNFIMEFHSGGSTISWSLVEKLLGIVSLLFCN